MFSQWVLITTLCLNSPTGLYVPGQPGLWTCTDAAQPTDYDYSMLCQMDGMTMQLASIHAVMQDGLRRRLRFRCEPK